GRRRGDRLERVAPSARARSGALVAHPRDRVVGSLSDPADRRARVARRRAAPGDHRSPAGARAARPIWPHRPGSRRRIALRLRARRARPGARTRRDAGAARLMSSLIGSEIGSYRVDGKLGQGGMGEVFTATQPLIGKRVAIKVLLPAHSERPELVERFFREARATALLNHPGTVNIFDTGTLPDGRAYLVMDLLEGQSLSARQFSGPITPPELYSIGRQVADVLDAAHAKGILHRDLKPDNVFLIADKLEPGGVRVKLLDFGIAKLLDATAAVKTKTTAILGTPPYMSPEQCRGAGFTDKPTDVYALGCILFEMCCGRTPFVAKGFGDYLAMHVMDAPPKPSSLAPCDPRLEALILRALAKDAAERPTAARMRDELAAIAKAPAAVASVTAGSGPPPPAPSQLVTTAPMTRPAPGPATTQPETPAPVEDHAPAKRRVMWIVLAALIAGAVAAVALLR